MWKAIMNLFSRRPLDQPRILEERELLRLQRDFERDRMNLAAGAWLDTLTSSVLDDLKPSSKPTAG
jgi:hypothetical protein